MSATSRRPAGVTLLALALFWLFLSAVGNLFVWRSPQLTLFPSGSPAAGLVEALTGPLFVFLVSLYGVTALVAAIAAWRMLSWMSVAFLVWSVAALVLGAFFLQVIPASLLMGGGIAAAVFVAGLAVVLWMIYRYLRRVTPDATDARL
jgi:hypothetical protein